MADKYDHKEIEKKWQEKWSESGAFNTTEGHSKPKTYVLDMFPYPSGEGLHVGHPRGYIATDIYSRYMRMRGHNVLHPMGWDAFGLPAENFALKNKVHPRDAVEKNIAHFKEQLSHIGFDYDWSREINTTDPAYYKWTQWIFLQMFKKGLAYQSNEPINWCPSCMTGLANEDLDKDQCERCGTKVEKKALPQWVLKITAYADRMLQDLDQLQWPEHIKEAQRNWIGRSEGAEITFPISRSNLDGIKVFTTRPDTLFGATYVVLAPEHPLIQELTIENREEVNVYIESAKTKTEIERGAAKEKTGVELKGVKAIHPANKEEVPVFVADYVLGGYGTGAIMAVPAHDERDFEFAQKFNLPIKQVVMPSLVDISNPPQEGKENTFRDMVLGILYDPKEKKYLTLKWKTMGWTGFVTGGVEEGENRVDAIQREIAEETGYINIRLVRSLGMTEAFFFAGHKNVNRKTHGEHFLFELVDNTQAEVTEEEKVQFDLQWLSEDELLSTKIQHVEFPMLWHRIKSGNDTYVESGILINSGEFNGLTTEEAKKKITEFVGGTITTTYKLKDWVFSRQRYWGEPIPIIHCPEHGAVAVPEDQLPVLLPEVESYEPSGTGESPLANIKEFVDTRCPQCGGPAKRETNTMPQWAGSSWYYLRFLDPNNSEALVSKEKEKYWAPVDVYVGGDHAVRHLIYARFWHKFLFDIGVVNTVEPFERLEFLGFILAEDGRKMSKRYGNVINPDDVVGEYGADSFRLYEMFIGPFENTTRWNTSSISGVSRFIERLWKTQDFVIEENVVSLHTILEQTVKKVGEDIEAFKFNTAVSQMMIFLNAIEKEKAVGKKQWQKFLSVLSPFAPHVAHELAERAGDNLELWPSVDESKLVSEIATIAVQINGKVRGTIKLPKNASQEEALLIARNNEDTQKWVVGEPTKIIYVPGRVLNLVI